MLILEGPDGGGKTTLAHELGDFFDIPLAQKVVKSDTTTDIELIDWVDNNLEEGRQWAMFDRHALISEPIYGTIIRNKVRSSEFAEVGWMTSRLQQFYDIMPTIVYCLPPLETVLDNVANDPDNVAIKLFAERIYTSYVSRAATDYALSPGNVIIWDYTTAGTPSYDALFRSVERLQKETIHA